MSESVFEPPSRFVEPAAMCPWREPEADLRQFFPGATGYTTEIKILSGQRLELQQRLGRMLDASENSLYVYRVNANGSSPGAVLTRRVKAEHGAIELVLALDTERRVRGLKLQRLREPQSIVDALQDPGWLGSFVGKHAQAQWVLGRDVPAVPGEARASAESVIQGVRSLLILLDTAESRPALAPHH